MWSVMKLHSAIISPHDGNKLNGANGCIIIFPHFLIDTNDIYGQTYGARSFYEQQAAYDAYEARLRLISPSYFGKYSGKAWRD
ncbi:Mannan endo-1,4-beta-mannosidase [Purpureocillium takamizusanense]|uniref:Mannan endo-1,4-beta-mannosidase n=1 Tax=Purpureocillium takamizusanense TaxID=2060973 RepID=A0A9Q8QM03_9HYPO|nr:Mannan endo-1,4-beta-mannosidase [Purpureocillium takamizusanense]UNI21672.1 Mannan endo-1,4-beta-mannosidase [Purpureocillium takamizusanense]